VWSTIEQGSVSFRGTLPGETFLTPSGSLLFPPFFSFGTHPDAVEKECVAPYSFHSEMSLLLFLNLSPGRSLSVPPLHNLRVPPGNKSRFEPDIHRTRDPQTIYCSIFSILPPVFFSPYFRFFPSLSWSEKSSSSVSRCARRSPA